MCEDFPCCGHEQGCCPDYDEETGESLLPEGINASVNAVTDVEDAISRPDDFQEPEAVEAPAKPAQATTEPVGFTWASKGGTWVVKDWL